MINNNLINNKIIKEGSSKNIVYDATLFILICICLLMLSACSLPTEQRMAYAGGVQSTLVTINPDSLLAKRILPDNQEHQGKSGVFMLYDGQDAFTARLALIEKAEHSIDAQYYIWHDDISGRLLLNRLYKAANRGVKVRLLLDDNSTVGMDGLLTRLNSHANIEVRLFNPYVQRKFRSIAYFTDTVRINRRMHNKSFTVDGVISIIGGRNVGDEYFSANHELLFTDLDVSLVGKVVPDIRQDFNRYWQSESSYPLELIVNAEQNKPTNNTVNNRVPNNNAPNSNASNNNAPNSNVLNNNTSNNNAPNHNKLNTQKPIDIINKNKTKRYLMNVLDTKYPQYLTNHDYPLIWTDAYYFSDSPNKPKQGRAFQYKDSLLAKIMPFIASTERQLILVSPYFVPTELGTQYLTEMVKQGKRVVVITNSLSSTDVTIVHSAYQKYRKRLLAGGVELYEFKEDPQNDEYGTKDYRKKYQDTYNVNGSLPNSGASLHAKASVIDDKYVFVGSSNFDPRSVMLNTEDGVILQDKTLARVMSKALEQNLDIINYKLALTRGGKLLWHTLEDGRRVVYYHEPETPLKDRIFSEILAMLPIDGWL